MLTFKRTHLADRVESVCRSWEGAPYRLNGCSKLGVDCLHFAASVLDELYGVSNSRNLRSLPPDACVHNKPGVMAAGRALLTAYPAFKRYRGSVVEPGDLVMFGPSDGDQDAVQHLTVAGDQVLWQATQVRVLNMPIAAPFGLRLACIYRASDTHLWIN